MVPRSRSGLSSLLVIAVMLLSPCSGLLLVTMGDDNAGSRAVVDRFDSGELTWTYTFQQDQVWKGATFTVNNNSYIDEAAMLVRGLEYSAGTTDYPEDVELDFGDDGDIEWAFTETGFGKLGYQYELQNDSLSSMVSVSAGGQNSDTRVRLPLNATITNATLNIEGLFRFEDRLLINGTEAGEEMGRSVSFVGDLNGDTWADFAVAAPKNSTTGGDDRGRVLVFFGGAGLDDTPDLVLYGEDDNHDFGYKVTAGGDLNNDNYDDLLIGVPLYEEQWDLSNIGAVYVYFGGDPMDGTADLVMKGQKLGDWFGRGVAGVGDFDNDGYDDVVSGSPNWGIQTGPEDFDFYGKLYLFRGGAAMDNISDLSMQGPDINKNWGHTVSPAGDVNNDGYDDFILGTYNHAGGCADCGKLDLFLGGNPPDLTPDVTIYGSGGEELGYSAAPLGDLNKDGFDDFIVGAATNKDKGLQTGAAYVFLGSGTPDLNPDLVLHGTAGGDWFGTWVSNAGDINNDGWRDIIVGAEMNTTEFTDSGAVFVFFGGATLDNETDIVIPGLATDDRFGSSVSGGSDINKDGYYDILIGAFLNDSKANSAGIAYLYQTVPKKVTDPVLDLTGPNDPPGDLWNFTGMYIGNITVPDFNASLNQYLQSADATGTDDYGNQYVDVAFGVESGTDAEFVISNISVFYQYDAVVDVNPTTLSLRQELDGKLGHKDTGTVTINIRARSHTKGRVLMHGLHIVTDEGPNVTVIPTTNMDEDTYRPQLLDLYDHFDDDIDPDDFLTYDIVSYTNAEYVNVTLNQSHYLSVDALTGDMNDNWTGTTDVVVNATDVRGLEKRSDTFTINIVEVNDAPVITSDPIPTATATRVYTYQMTAVDDNGPLSYSLASGPTGMSADIVTGLVTWTPASVGTYDVSLIVGDGDLTAYQNFSILVNPPNDPPVITSTPGPKGTVGIEYTYQLKATDVDDDEMTAELVTGPSGMVLDQDWLVSMIPATNQVGDHEVVLLVSDGKENTTQAYTLTITQEGMNNVPYFVSTPPLTAVVGHGYSYQLAAEDIDGHSLDFSLDTAPAGMALHSDLIEWVPTDDQVGPNDVVARVSDRKAYALQDFTIEVTRTGANNPPVIYSTPPTTASVGYTYTYQVEARDDDLDALIYSIDIPFSRMTIDPDTGLLIWHPTSEATGNQTLRVRVSDGKGFDTQEFVVMVQAGSKNGLPIFLSEPIREGKVGVQYSYQPQVQDPDLDPVTFSLAEGPEGMDIVQTTGLITWVPTDGQEGNATVEVRASDGKGYTFQKFTILVVPADLVQEFVVTITSPTAGQKVSGNLTIEGTASVTVGELYEVQVRIDKGTWVTASGLGSWSLVYDTKKAGNGQHTIGVRAWDGSGYSDIQTVVVEVENKDVEEPREPLTIMGLDAAMFFLLLIVLLAVVVGIIMVFRKGSGPRPPPAAGRRRREEEPPPERARARRPAGRRDERDYDDDYEDDPYDDGYDDEYDKDYRDDDYAEDEYYDDHERGHEYDH